MSDLTPDRHITSLPTIVTLAAFSLLGNLVAVIFPVLVGALIDSGLSASQVGYIESADLTGIAVGALLWARLILRVNWRVAAACAIPLAIAGNVLCIVMPGFAPVLAGRFLAGLGSGVFCGIGSAGLALTRRPERTYGLCSTANMVAAAVLVYAFTFLSHRGGSAAMLAGVSLVLATLLLTLKLLPARSLAGANAASGRPAAAPGVGGIPWLSGSLALAAIWAYFVAALVFWTFPERIAVHAGFTTAFTAQAFGVGQLMGAAGALTTAVLASFSRRRFPPMLGYLALALGAALLFTTEPRPWSFAAAVCMLFYSWSGIYPYFVGTVVTLDPTARLVSLMVGISFLGKSMAPPIAGALADGSDYSRAYYFAAMGFAFCLALILIPVLRGDRAVAVREAARVAAAT